MFAIEEMEFFAQQEKIQIIPSFTMSSIEFIQGEFGPFQPLKPVQVPLWLALEMKKNQNCRIIAPNWLSEKEKLQLESKTDSEFVPMPSHFIEISKMLLEWAPEDVENSSSVNSLLQDLIEKRQKKLRKGIQTMNPWVLTMNHLTPFELNELRDFLLNSFSFHRKFHQ